MSTLENFQLGEGPAKPSNHDDCEVRPISVDVRYYLWLEMWLLLLNGIIITVFQNTAELL